MGKGSAPAKLGDELRDVFKTKLRVGRVRVLYRAGLILVAMAMVVLPLLYVALIALLGFGVYYHAVNDIGILGGMSHGYGGRWRIILLLTAYFGPIVMGIVAIFFMFKPVLARRSGREHSQPISPEANPLLFYFVKQLCAMIRSPAPTQVCVDMEVNASARFRKGFTSMLGNDLVLTIGLPLVSGLSLRQFAGVLAHEFGHFSQGAGMRATYVIRSINYWFARVVYERDQWDVALDDAVLDPSSHDAYRLVLQLTQVLVWLTRKILYALMMAGHAISSFMLRQMEYDADRYEIIVAGSRTFVSTARRMRELQAAREQVHARLRALWDDGKIADDLPFLVSSTADSFPAGTRSAINRIEVEGKTGLFDTHPCDLDRGRRAYRNMTEGVFSPDYPAGVLFKDFDELCRDHTLRYLRDELDVDVRQEHLVSSKSIREEMVKEEEQLKVFSRYYFDALTAARPVSIPSDDQLASHQNAEAIIGTLVAARKYLQENAEKTKEALIRFTRADERASKAEQARVLIGAGVRIEPAELGLRRASIDEVERSIKECDSMREEIAAEIDAFNDRLVLRLVSAVRLLRVDEFRNRIDGAERMYREAASLLAFVKSIGGLGEPAAAWHTAFGTSLALIRSSGQHHQDASFQEELEESTARLYRCITAVRDSTALVQNPFKRDKQAFYISEHVFGSIPPPEQPLDLLQANYDALQKYFGLYHEAMGKLAVIAECVEAVLAERSWQ